jgi:ribosomal protein L19E
MNYQQLRQQRNILRNRLRGYYRRSKGQAIFEGKRQLIEVSILI